MKQLSNREEEILAILWDMEKAFVKEIITKLPDPKPHYNTISTIIRTLEEKGYVAYESFGNSHRYYPIVSKEVYQKKAVKNVIHNFFDNSYKKMVAFFAEEEEISEEELKDIIRMIKKKKS